MSKPNPLRRRTRAGALVRTAGQVKAETSALSAGIARAAQAVTTSSDAPAAANEGTTVGELWLYGLVGGYWSGFDAESVANAIRGLDVDEIHVRIHSPGGRADQGIAIANLLRNHKARVITVIDGIAASAASVIAVAGDEVVMCPGSQLMLHDAATGMCVWGDAEWLRTQVEELQRVADWIDGQSQNYAGVYAYKAGGTAEQWREVMTANGLLGTWYTGEAAVAAKLADRVGTITAVGSPPVAPVDDWDENDEEMVARVQHDLQILEQCVSPSVRDAWQGDHLSTPKPPTASADGFTTPQEGSSLVTRISDAGATTIGQKLGIAEDADEATILAALDEALDERTEPDAPTTPQIPEGHVTIPAAKLADLEAAATLATTTAKSLHDKDRATFLDSVRDKFLPTSRAGWEAEFDRDEAGVRAHFAAAPVLIPTAEIGHGDDSEDDDTAFEAAHAAVLAKHGIKTEG